jgi:cation transporter-like permease
MFSIKKMKLNNSEKKHIEKLKNSIAKHRQIWWSFFALSLVCAGLLVWGLFVMRTTLANHLKAQQMGVDSCFDLLPIALGYPMLLFLAAGLGVLLAYLIIRKHPNPDTTLLIKIVEELEKNGEPVGSTDG